MHQQPFSAARADPGFVGRLGAAGRTCRGLTRFGLKRCRGMLGQEQQAGSINVLALGGVPQAEVADLVQAFRQDVLQEPAHELMAGDATGPPSV